MAQTLASLDELTGGRIVLAPGACTDKHARRHGLAPITPAVTLKEWVETVRLLLAGDKVTYKGESVTLEGAGLNWRPARSRIPFWFAALSRTGLRLAGQLADGVVLDAHTSPEYVENAVKILKDAAREAGRDWDGLRGGADHSLLGRGHARRRGGGRAVGSGEPLRVSDVPDRDRAAPARRRARHRPERFPDATGRAPSRRQARGGRRVAAPTDREHDGVRHAGRGPRRASNATGGRASRCR